MSYVICSWCDGHVDLAGVQDDDALIDFVEALMMGETDSARALVSRAFVGDDIQRIDRLFAQRVERRVPMNGVFQ